MNLYENMFNDSDTTQLLVIKIIEALVAVLFSAEPIWCLLMARIINMD